MNTVISQLHWRDQSFSALARAVHDSVNSAVAHQELPFDDVLDIVASRGVNRHPLFDVMCIYQNMPLPPLRLDGLTATPATAFTGIAKFDVTLILEPRREGVIDVTFEYKADKFTVADIDGIAGGYRALLESVVADADQSCSAMPVMAGDVERMLMDGDHSVQSFSAVGSTVLRAIASTVNQKPDAIAVLADSGQS